jgi:hypothetical protein
VDAVNNRVGILTASPAATFDVAGMMRTTAAPAAPATGAGVETYYDGTQGVIQVFDRGGSAFKPLLILGSAVTLYGDGAAVRFKVDGTGVGFFATGPVAQQTGGSATAGALYTATEQGMLNAAYAAMRAYGLLT